ncbi:MAG: hypothetical protein Q9187_001807 [Circinaria calcarea]
MSTPYICVRCRQSINARTLLSRRQSQPQCRSFISFKNPEPQGSTDAPKSQPREAHSGPQSEAQGWHRKQLTRPRQRKVESTVTNDLLEDLFTSTQRRMPTLPLKSRYSKTLNATLIAGKNDVEALKDDIALLGGMLYIEKAPVEKVWVALENLPSFGIQAPDKPIRKYKNLEVETVFRDLLFAVVERRSNPSDLSLVPTPGEVIGRYVRHGLMGNWWNSVLWQLLRAYSRVEHTLDGKGIPSHDPEKRAGESLLKDTLEVWKVYVENFGVLSGPDTRKRLLAKESIPIYKVSSLSPGLSGWPGLPSTEDVVASCETLPEDFRDRFTQFFPQGPMQSTAGSTAIAAVMTCQFLRDIEMIGNSEDLKFSGSQLFSGFVVELIKGSKLDNAILQSCAVKEEIPLPMVHRLTDQWDHLQNNVQGNTLEQEQNRMEFCEKSRPVIRKLQDSAASTIQKQRVSTLSMDLRKAVKQSDLKYATKLWDRMKRKIEHHEVEPDMLSEAFAEFLASFTALGRPDKAIDVWNTMVRAGCKPYEEHWIAMLDGCRKARDLPSLQTLWQNIKTSGVRIRNELWRMYLSGLLQCRDWQAALKALEELGRAWKKSTTHTVPRPDAILPQNTDTTTDSQQDQLLPSIIPINTVISGLIALNQTDAVKTVLRWANLQKVKPDISTFNILLRPAVRKDLRGEIQRILQEMQKSDCQPDVVTFTILLDGLFRNPTSSFQSQSLEEQQKAVSQIFQDMKDMGIEANTYTYSTILDSLLSPRSFNLAAARAVLARMTDRNIKPSPHIYTILITHYFSTAPPNLPAIDSLWRRIRLDKSPTDHVFYDRMIEGYSRVGEIEKMLAFLRRMPAEGKTPGWIALLGVLRALAQVQEWDLVRDLVRDVVDERALFRNGSRGWKGEEEFWALVESLRARGVNVPERPARREERMG